MQREEGELCSQRAASPQILGEAPSPDMDREEQAAPKASLRDQGPPEPNNWFMGQGRLLHFSVRELRSRSTAGLYRFRCRESRPH